MKPSDASACFMPDAYQKICDNFSLTTRRAFSKLGIVTGFLLSAGDLWCVNFSVCNVQQLVTSPLAASRKKCSVPDKANPHVSICKWFAMDSLTLKLDKTSQDYKSSILNLTARKKTQQSFALSEMEEKQGNITAGVKVAFKIRKAWS